MTLEQTFIDALRALGGSAGNQRLREALGWQEASYDQIKSSLVQAGLIVPGRGRGGTVALPGERATSRLAAGGKVSAPKAAKSPGSEPKPASATELRRGGPVRKSDLYASLWASCDELRGGMDASQYKDYVLTMLFMKYVSDKYKGDPYGMIVVPQGASFDDMVALKGDKEIGDKINKIISALAEENEIGRAHV